MLSNALCSKFVAPTVRRVGHLRELSVELVTQNSDGAVCALVVGVDEPHEEEEHQGADEGHKQHRLDLKKDVF